MRSAYFLSVVALLMLLLQGFVFVFMVDKFEHSRNDFQVTEELFTKTVSSAVEKYLHDLSGVSSPMAVAESSNTFDYPACVFVDQLGTWISFNGPRCRVDGITYGVGDFTPYGLVRHIGDGKVYCSSTNGFAVIRGRMRDAGPPARAAAAETANEFAPL